jgi:formylglycine-generating enzyme required for sulfatase activity
MSALPLLVALLLAGPVPAPDRVAIPAGAFEMGDDDAHFDEAPRHRVRVSAFAIDRVEVDVARFAAFVLQHDAHDAIEGPWFRVSADGCVDLLRHLEKRHRGSLAALSAQPHPDLSLRRDLARWRAAVAALRDLSGEDATEGIEAVARRPSISAAAAAGAALPIRFVTWRDAQAFCAASGARLPTEAEWERAARGTDPARCVLGSKHPAPEPVGSHPECRSAAGVLDLSGNVWEWVSDWYGEHYYEARETDVDPQGPSGLANGELPGPRPGVNLLRSPLQGRESDTRKVIRGGGFGGPEPIARDNGRPTRRLWSNPGYWHPDVGFRCVAPGK